MWGGGFLGSDGRISPALHTEPQTMHMAKSSWTFVGGSLFIGSKSQKKSWGGLAVNVLVAGASCSGWLRKVFNPSVFNPLVLIQRGLIPLCLTQRALIPWCLFQRVLIPLGLTLGASSTAAPTAQIPFPATEYGQGSAFGSEGSSSTKSWGF